MFVALFIWFVHTMMGAKNGKQTRQVQVVQLIRPPPPPPPDQPPPPPPEKTDEPIPKDEPDPAPDDQPAPSPNLGIDAEGSAGGDAFGLAARRGGSDLLGSGGSAFAWYTGRVRDAMIDQLASDSKITSKKYSIAVRVWIEADGRIKETQLLSSTGSREIDERIESRLKSLTRMSDAPPLEMPRLVIITLVSRI